MEDVIQAFLSLANLDSIVILLLGSVIGIIFGAIPGLGPAVAAALLIPFTYTMEPVYGILLIAGVYVSATFGGSQTAILFNIPGAPENTCTTIDGYKLTLKGKASKALGIAIVSSAVGGILSSIALIIGSTQLVKISYLFGPLEYFALTLMGMAIITSLSEDYLKGLISGAFGILLSTVGMSNIDGTVRLSFGQDYLLNGFDFVAIMIGAYAVGEVFNQINKGIETKANNNKFKVTFPKREDIKEVKNTILRSSLLGIIIGALPGAGAVLANYLGYGIEEKIHKNSSDPLGDGNIKGVSAPEAANNSAAVATFIPLLALGIPGGAVTAILLGVFEVHGLQPGPTLFLTSKDLVYTLFLGILFINLFILILGFFEVKVITKLLKVPSEVLYSIIIVFASLGAYALNNSMFDVMVMFIFGFISWFMKDNQYSVPIMVLGLVLGPIMENNLIRALINYDSPIYFFTDLEGAALLLISIFFFITPIFKKKHKIKTKKS